MDFAASFGTKAARQNVKHLADVAHVEEIELWRWFCRFFEDGRLRWCRSAAGWSISVDHIHLSTEANFHDAIRLASDRFYVGGRRNARA